MIQALESMVDFVSMNRPIASLHGLLRRFGPSA